MLSSTIISYSAPGLWIHPLIFGVKLYQKEKKLVPSRLQLHDKAFFMFKDLQYVTGLWDITEERDPVWDILFTL